MRFIENIHAASTWSLEKVIICWTCCFVCYLLPIIDYWTYVRENYMEAGPTARPLLVVILLPSRCTRVLYHVSVTCHSFSISKFVERTKKVTLILIQRWSPLTIDGNSNCAVCKREAPLCIGDWLSLAILDNMTLLVLIVIKFTTVLLMLALLLNGFNGVILHLNGANTIVICY